MPETGYAPERGEIVYTEGVEWFLGTLFGMAVLWYAGKLAWSLGVFAIECLKGQRT